MKINCFLKNANLKIILCILTLSSFLFGCKSIEPEISKQIALKYYPVLYNGTLLGGSANVKKPDPNQIGEPENYIEPSKMSEFVVDGMEYKLYNKCEYVGVGIGGELIHDKEDAYSAERVEIKNDEWTDEIFSMSCDWDCVPRKSTEETTTPESEQLIKDFLVSEGIENPELDVLYEQKIDIDGDSADEVLIYAENKGDKNNYYNKGDFTVMILRKTINNEIKNIVIKLEIGKDEYDIVDNYIPEGASIRYFFKIEGFYDVDGDNEMEILIESSYVEGVSYEVYKINYENSKLILSNRWGI